MSHVFTRHLTFQANNLGKEASIMLAFDNNMEGLYEDFFPVVWKCIQGLSDLHEPVVDGNLISAETSVKINDSEKTTLTEVNDVYHFSVPQAGTAGVLQAVNSTGAVQDMAVGFINKGDLMPTPALYFNDVGDGSHVTARFTPVLRAYITSDYQETAILRGAIDTPAIWTHDLTALAESTTWNLERDAVTGHYTLVQV
ncbi:hypothetical protein BDR05DRAFT_950540 [Suillus weaverae]|nr:hypothetical protein BDR05DRAFT_950540 [Suillus weaverae]